MSRLEEQEVIKLGGRIAPMFNRRCGRRLDFLQTHQLGGREPDRAMGYNRSGDYGQECLVACDYQLGGNEYWRRQEPFWDEFNHRSNPWELVGLELFYAKQIRKVLERKPEVPALLVDVGGRVAVSWARLTKEFEEEIRSSRIAFVASNLVYGSPADFIDEEDYIANRQVVDGTQGLLTYIKGDAGTLLETELTLPNGHQLPLRGNVDILHERYSIHQWSFVPELEILQAASLLSPFGLYLAISGRPDGPIGLHLDGSMGEEIARLQGIRFAHQALVEQYSLRVITEVEGGDLKDAEFSGRYWWIFRKEQAPPIEINR